MKILEIRELAIPLSGQISNAVVNFSNHTVSLVAIVTDQVRGGQPVSGVAFNSIGRFAQSGIIRDRLIPRILACDPEEYSGEDGLSPGRLLGVMMRDEKPGGHGDRASAAAALELAAWDLRAKLAGEPAFLTIARAFRRAPAGKVSVYAAGGYYYPGDTVARLEEELKTYQDLGFNAFKMKIGGAPEQEDLSRLETAIRVAGSGGLISVDANGRFGFEGAARLGALLRPYGVRWYEEAVDPLDYETNRRLIEDFGGPVATGENLFSVMDVQNLVRHGGMRPGTDIFQMDAGLSYGLTEYARMIDLLEIHGFSRTSAWPHGGHLLNLHIVAGLGLGGCEAYPAVFEPFGGYLPELEIRDGMIGLPDAPGFGLEAKPELAPFIAELLA